MRPFKRRDDNEGEIVLALRAIGATVCTIADFGTPDLLVGYRGRTILIEIKNPASNKGGRQLKSKGGSGKSGLTDTQVRWWDAWTGGEAYVVTSAEEAVAIVRGVMAPCLKLATHDMFGNVHLCVGSSDIETMSPAEADSLAGAIHEAAGFARGNKHQMDNGGSNG